MLDSVSNNFYIITDESISNNITIANSFPSSEIEGIIQRDS
jgi:hypothetical protein